LIAFIFSLCIYLFFDNFITNTEYARYPFNIIKFLTLPKNITEDQLIKILGKPLYIYRQNHQDVIIYSPSSEKLIINEDLTVTVNQSEKYFIISLNVTVHQKQILCVKIENY
jgi:hypothetical protein